jgi:release factor glutamine methyltransferase
MNDEVWNIRRVLAWMTGFFERKGIEGARLDAELLTADALHIDRVRLYLDLNKPLSNAELGAIRAHVSRRGQREPVAYIVGRKGFWTLELAVDARVLVPRPETERLVELALEALRDTEGPVLADVGCGSGCVALALAAERPDATIHAIDCSTDALAVARANGEALGEAVQWHAGELLDPVAGPLDLVVSNPPYIPTATMADLMPEVTEYEPTVALDGGPDGLDVIRRLVPAAAARLRPGGKLLFEIGSDQGAEAKAIVEGHPAFSAVVVHRDYAKLDRVVEATRVQGST